MTYKPEHKIATRARILQSAGRLFRKHGYDCASIDDIMGAAGLTRGGFYAHFKSKQDLFAAVVGEELEFTKELRNGEVRMPEDPKSGAAMAIDYYLSPANRDRVAQGCTVVSNAADIARSRVPARRAFTKVFRELAAEFEGLVEAPAQDKDDRALASLATCVGAVVLARALADEPLVEQLMESCRAHAVRALEG